MVKCKYCNGDVSFFFRSHKECKEKHEKGLLGLKSILQKYFEGRANASKLKEKISQNKAPYFLSDEDIANAASEAIGEFTQKLRRPYSFQHLNIVSEFTQNIGISYSQLNRNGSMDRLGQKMMYGFYIDYFAQITSINQANNNLTALTNIIPLDYDKTNAVYINVLNKAANKFMKNGVLSDNEETLIKTFIQNTGLCLNALSIQSSNTDYEKILQAIVLKNLGKGIYPTNTLSVPVLLGKGECTLWVYHNVTMFQEKIQREYHGKTGGFNIRICKGLTYRTGQFKGHPVEHRYLDKIGIGSLVVTDKHIYFHCPTASIKVPYSKLIGVEPYSDGIELHKDDTKSKRIVFQGFDCWFIMNVLSLLK